MAPEANVTEWLTWAVQIVTGSFERDGGAWFNPGAFGRAHERPTGWHGIAAAVGPGPTSRPDLASRFGEWPCAALADEIEAGNVRALLVIGGNPLTSLPDTARLEAACAGLDVLAVADVIRSDTARLASHVLPVAGQLERDDITWFTDRFAPVISAQRTDAVVAPGGERRRLVDVLQDLGERMGMTRDPDPMARYVARLPALSEPGVVVADPPRVKGWVHDRVLPSGRWELAPAPLVGWLRSWGRAAPPALAVVPRRSVHRMNSALRDLARGDDDTEAWLNPVDAARCGSVHDGDLVTISSETGTITARAKVTADVVPGAVSVPHGLAAPNVSKLTGSRPGRVDPLTGMIVQSGLPVTVQPAVDPDDVNGRRSQCDE
jgi:anaerobic selenocysteine-containing dehydrogenase